MLAKTPEAPETSHVIIGTPGVLLQCVKLRKLSLEHVKTFVFDEADELFKEKDVPLDVSAPVKGEKKTIKSKKVGG